MFGCFGLCPLQYLIVGEVYWGFGNPLDMASISLENIDTLTEWRVEFQRFIMED